MNSEMNTGVGKGPHSKSRGRIQVALLDDTVVAFEVETRTKGEVLYTKVNEHLNLEESEYFGLQYLDSEENVCWVDSLKSIRKQVKEPSKVTFKFRVMFYAPDPNTLQEYTRYLFTLQVRRDLLDGRLHCSEDTGALLASFIVQGELGDFDPLSHKVGYLSGFQFVPHQTDVVEDKIIDYHKSHRGQTPSEADHNMLDVARQLEMYGMIPYPAKDGVGTELSLSVYHMGLIVFQNAHRINSFSWALIRKLSFKKKKLLIKLHYETNIDGIIEFTMKTRNACKGFWKVCIAHHAFFRQRSATDQQRRRSLLSRGSRYRYSGRTQKQIFQDSKERVPNYDGERSCTNRNTHPEVGSNGRKMTPGGHDSKVPMLSSFHSSQSSSCQNASADEGSISITEDSPIPERTNNTTEEQSPQDYRTIDLEQPVPVIKINEDFEEQHIIHMEHSEPSKAANAVVTVGDIKVTNKEEGKNNTNQKAELEDEEEESMTRKIEKEYDSGRGGWQYQLTSSVIDSEDGSQSPVVDDVRCNGIHSNTHSLVEEKTNDQSHLDFNIDAIMARYSPSHADDANGCVFADQPSNNRQTLDNAEANHLFDDEAPLSRTSSLCSSRGGDSATDSIKRSRATTDNATFFMARELLLTERTYVKDLEVLTVSFRSVLSQDDVLPASLQSLLFNNIDPLYDFHCSLLAEIEERLSLWEKSLSSADNDSCQHIGDIMQRNMKQVMLYTSYIQRHDQILIELEKEARSSKQFEKAYKEFELQKICYLPLIAFLLKPVQRLLYYRSILGRIYKELPRDHAHLQDAKSAYDDVMQACKTVGDSMRNLENLHKMVELERDLLGVESLVHPVREFIREGCLHKVCRKGPQPRMFFLFSDLLMYTSQGVTSTNQFRVRAQIPLHTIKVEEGGVQLHGLYSFTIYSGAGRSFVVAASSPEEKYKWMEDLQASITKAKAKLHCLDCNAYRPDFVSLIGKDLSLLCPTCRNAVNHLDQMDADQRSRFLSSIYAVPVTIRKHVAEGDSDDENQTISPDFMSSLDRRHAHARTMSTRRLCWHRNTSISMSEYTLSVQNNLSGELLRKLKNSNKWQKLWVVFTNFCLFFFKSYEEEAPLASLPLIGYSISKPSEVDNVHERFALKVQFKTHVYFFRATNEYAYDRWMEVLCSATRSASRTRIFSRLASNEQQQQQQQLH